jgi:hypothetical protein
MGYGDDLLSIITIALCEHLVGQNLTSISCLAEMGTNRAYFSEMSMGVWDRIFIRKSYW